MAKVAKKASAKEQAKDVAVLEQELKQLRIVHREVIAFLRTLVYQGHRQNVPNHYVREGRRLLDKYDPEVRKR